MKSIFLKSALNRSDDRSKRNNIAAYERYLDKSIEKAIQKLAETIIGSIGGEADIMNSWIKIDDSSLAEF